MCDHAGCTPLDTTFDPRKAAGASGTALRLPLGIGGQTRTVWWQDGDDRVHDDALVVHRVSERPDMSDTHSQ